MSQIETVSEGPVRDLFLAINHYVSTGDHIGEGVAMEAKDGRLILNIPYDPRNPDDRDDAKRLTQRLAEIRAEHPEIVTSVEKRTQQGRFELLLLYVQPIDTRRLAAALVRSSGAAGWGSGKHLLDQHFPDVRGKLLSGEGV